MTWVEFIIPGRENVRVSVPTPQPADYVSSGPPWVDEQHMMHAGLLAGTLLGHGLSARPVHDQDGVVTPILHIEDESGYGWAVIVMPRDSTTGVQPRPVANDDDK